MAGPSLEVFRFGLYAPDLHSYLAFPLAFMLYFGDPAWYDKHVLPVRTPSMPMHVLTQVRHRFEPPETDFVRTHSSSSGILARQRSYVHPYTSSQMQACSKRGTYPHKSLHGATRIKNVLYKSTKAAKHFLEVPNRNCPHPVPVSEKNSGRQRTNPLMMS